MSGGSVKEIDLGNDFGAVIVKVNGDRIAVGTDGYVIVYPAANDVTPRVSHTPEVAPEIGPKVGDRMPDGTIYAGISPATNKAMFATPNDAPLTYTFNDAAKHAESLNAQKFLDHDDWRVPTKGELDELFENRAKIGGFNETGSYPAGWYWSSTQNNDNNAWAQRFSDGYQYSYGLKNFDSSLRCVRG